MDRCKHRRLSRVAFALLVGMLTLTAQFAAGPQSAQAGGPDREAALQIFNRDVYEVVGSSLRNPTADTDPDAPLYSDFGAYLGVTWGQWQAATASATTHSATKHTDVRIQLSGLIPNGVYSAFYITLSPDSEHPLCQNVERSLPLISRDKNQLPDPSSFIADANGNAEFRARVDGRLLDALQVIYAIIYHADGMTYHPFPNRGEWYTHNSEFGCRSSFGHDAMRQLLIVQKY